MILLKIKRHVRTGPTTKEEIYNVVLIGNTFGKYDVAIQTRYNTPNLFREAPYLGIMDYSPNKQKIINAYNKDHK